MSIAELSQEIEFFEANRQQLLAQHLGKFVLIKGQELIGVFDTDAKAYEEAVRLFGDEAFLIHEIQAEETAQDLPAYCLGLLYAGACCL